MLAAGDRVPEFSLLDQDALPVTGDALLAAGPLVLYFYPKDETPGCTREACAFRDAYTDFADAGASVVGVSADDPVSHKRFAERHRLPFRLLSDPTGALAKSFGVKKTLGILPGRVTFVIDRSGIVRYAFSSQIAPERHVSEALRVLKDISAIH
ncbi:MAG TPA: peroxiredoxin [Candidatus Acidoferrales bacterium]|nr:peroxiredoxin [Candidatus Acidoferrales bacterium]